MLRIFVLTLALLLPSVTWSQSPTTVSADSRVIMVSKDVGGQRWAITRDLRALTVTGNVFSPEGGPAQFVWCAQRDETSQQISFTCYGASPCGQVSCADTWSFIANVDLPSSFFAAGAAGEAGLPGLIGSWTFLFFYPSPFDDDYDLISTQFQEEIMVLVGRDYLDDPVLVARAEDLLPGAESPYEFVMLDPGSSLCRAFAFDRIGDQLRGVYFQLDMTDAGCNTSDLGTAYDARGIRRAALPVPGVDLSVAGGDEQVLSIGAPIATVSMERRAWVSAALAKLGAQ